MEEGGFTNPLRVIFIMVVGKLKERNDLRDLFKNYIPKS
jgi:hypothetical protein